MTACRNSTPPHGAAASGSNWDGQSPGVSASPRQVECFTAWFEHSDGSCGKYSDKFHRRAAGVDDLMLLEWRDQERRARTKRMRTARHMDGTGASSDQYHLLAVVE